MKVLVTGRRGQLARALAERWTGVDLHFAGREQADLSVSGEGARLIAGVRPDLVVSAAAYTAVDQAEDEPALAARINGEAPGELAEAAAGAGAAIIHISTDYVFDGRAVRPYVETDPTEPASVYGRTKLTGDRRVARANDRHIILRTAWLFSPWGRNFVRTMLRAGGERDAVRVVDDQHGSPTSALDLVDGIIAAAQAIARGDARWGLYHLAASGEATWFDVARAVMEEAKKAGLASARVDPIRTADWPTAAPRPAYTVLDSSKFADAFGFPMPHWRDSLTTVIERIEARAT